MLYIVGMGLERGDLTEKGLAALKKAKKIFVETYTSFPYQLENKELAAKVEEVNRNFVEEGNLLELAKVSDVVLLVPGDPLFATTHISLVKDANDKKVQANVIHAPSIINTISRTGLSPYKLGRVVTISKGFTSDSEKLKSNIDTGLHTLCLLDPAITLTQGLKVLKKFGVDRKVIACEQLGMKGEKIKYGSLDQLLTTPFNSKPQCIIVPAELHFFEKEFLDQFSCT
ncbi:MAG: diphthine synthase [Candidatus Altiarchaeota archaeon]|nr:diphthine synthase [Candidatus Altiarchaeota archaeon]